MNNVALRHRLKALRLSWLSSANWKAFDGRNTKDEHERDKCFMAVNAYEECANHLQYLIDELKNDLEN